MSSSLKQYVHQIHFSSKLGFEFNPTLLSRECDFLQIKKLNIFFSHYYKICPLSPIPFTFCPTLSGKGLSYSMLDVGQNASEMCNGMEMCFVVLSCFGRTNYKGLFIGF
jgi:hypothetical protein